MKDKNLQYYISRFLTTYLGGERGLSENTFISYNHTFQFLLQKAILNKAGEPG